MRMTKPTFGTMDPFDSYTDNWPVCTERLDQFFVANDIANGKKVVILLTVIGTKVYRNIVRKPIHPPQAGPHPQKHQNYSVESEELGLFTVKDAVHSGILSISINGTPITMKIDTGASISTSSEKTYKTQLPYTNQC